MPTSPQADPIHIFYPNGGTSAVQLYVWDGSKPVLWDGAVTFSGTISIGSVTGNTTSNVAAPTAGEQLGVLPAIATTAAPSYTNGRLVALSTDLTGALRVSATIDTSAIATSANQTNGAQKTQIVDGSGNVIGSTGNALQVNLKTSSITLPVSLTSTTITGNVTVVGNRSSDTAVPGSTNVGVLAGIATAAAPGYSEGSLVGLSTDLAGNLRTAATIDTTGLATSANQVTMIASLSVMDDWDETNRAAVNIIAGQVGVQGGSGGVTALTQRVVLATDVALPAGTNVIGHVITDTGSTTAVTGNVTVVQATASNLNVTATIAAGSAVIGHVITDSGSVTALTTGSAQIGHLEANQSVNLAQVAGTNTVNGGVAGSQSIGGTVATNVAITANPLNLGAQAVSSENSAVTTARQVQLVADLVGKLIVLPYANPENFVSGAITSAMTGTTSTSLIASPGGSLRNYITQVTVSNSHATVGTDVILQDGSGGTTLYTIPAAAVYGGATVSSPVPLRQPTTATALFCANVTTGASTKVSASGYKGL